LAGIGNKLQLSSVTEASSNKNGSCKMSEKPELIYDLQALDFARPGKHHYQLAFPLDSNWGYSLVPITIINGLRDAQNHDGEHPGIAVFGGTHGNEWEGQIAIKRLCSELDPALISGRIILIPQLSETACNVNSRVSGQDGVNMNRAFPGDASGTISKRVAHFVKSRVFPQVRVVIDVHSGGNEASFPLCTSFHPLADAAQFRETLQVARLFDTPFIFVYSRQMASGLLTDEAEDDGKITIGGEFGFGGGVNPQGVRHVVNGVRNVLCHYKMMDGDTTKIDVERPSAPRLVQAPNLVDYIPCPRDAVWEPLLRPGNEVRAGEIIGRLHDFSDHASSPLEMRAHRSGVVIALFFGAICRKGLTLFVIGEDLAA
jgi:predicted deacylase